MSISLIFSLIALILAILKAFVLGRYLYATVVLLAIINLLGSVHV